MDQRVGGRRSPVPRRQRDRPARVVRRSVRSVPPAPAGPRQWNGCRRLRVRSWRPSWGHCRRCEHPRDSVWDCDATCSNGHGGLSDRSRRWGSTCSRATGARRHGWPARRSTPASHRRPLAAPRSGSCCSCWATVMDGRFRAVECRRSPTRWFAGPNAKGRRSAATRRSSRCSCAAGGSWGSGSPMARRSRATPSSARSAPGCSRACCLPAHYPAGSTGGFGSGATAPRRSSLTTHCPALSRGPRPSRVYRQWCTSGVSSATWRERRNRPNGVASRPSRPRRRPAVAAQPSRVPHGRQKSLRVWPRAGALRGRRPSRRGPSPGTTRALRARVRLARPRPLDPPRPGRPSRRTRVSSAATSAAAPTNSTSS